MAAAPENDALARERSLECDGLFEGLYRGYRADVYEFSLRLVGKREDAEDVTQVAFLNAYRALARGNAPRKPRAWLFAIAHNVCMRHFRLQQRRPREVQLDPEVFESRGHGSGPTADDIRSALQALRSQERSALFLREFQGLSCAEIAARLGLSVSAVESSLFRARRTLREELETADIRPSVPARRRRTLGGLLPWPPGLEKLFSWLASLGRGGLAAKAAGVSAAAVMGTAAVVGTGVVSIGNSPARELPSEPARSTLLPSLELATARNPGRRPSTRASRVVAAQAPLVVPGTETAEASSAGGAVPAEIGATPDSTAGQSLTASQAPPSPATLSPPLELPPPELEPPSLPSAPPVPEASVPEPPPLEAPELPPPPELEPPALEPPALEPPALEPPSLEPPALEPPSLPPAPPVPEPPSLEPPELPPPPDLPLPPPPSLPLP
jgi:RNA polymerase sigma factor (sigma-70 family)